MKGAKTFWLLRISAVVGVCLCSACQSDTDTARQKADSTADHTNVTVVYRKPYEKVERRNKQSRLTPNTTSAIASTNVFKSVKPNAIKGVTPNTASKSNTSNKVAAKTKPTQQPIIQAGVFSVPSMPAVPKSRTTLVAFKSSAFPYRGIVPTTNKPFLNVATGERRAHRTFSNRVYWEDEVYSDPRVLVHIPRGFDINRPAVMVVYFHGHGATLKRDVFMRQQVPSQISESGMNAVLVAPQLALDARDSSPGKFWEQGGLKRFASEAADALAKTHGDPQSREIFANMPVIIVAYSGGYMATAWSLERGGLGKRVRGVVLMDALYGELDKFADWIIRQRSHAFFVSAFADSTRSRNSRLEQILKNRKIPVSNHLNQAIGNGSVVFIPTSSDTLHRDFVTRAWVERPIKDVLQRINLASR